MRRDRAFLEIQDGQTQIFIRLLDGQYPAIQSVLEKVEKQIQVEIKCDRRRLLQFLEQSILLQKGNDYATVDIQVAENLVLSTKTEDGESTRTMDFSWRFTDDVIAKSWRIQHWIQALKVIASPEVLIRMAHAAGFDIVASTGEESLMFAIAPMVKRG
jgi:DNA polymerase III sliding clamp (beta) subunit (PCNA family)